MLEAQEMDIDDEMDDDETDEAQVNDDINLTFPYSVDNKDYRSITLDDAINDKLHPPSTEWPNDTVYP